MTMHLMERLSTLTEDVLEGSGDVLDIGGVEPAHVDAARVQEVDAVPLQRLALLRCAIGTDDDQCCIGSHEGHTVEASVGEEASLLEDVLPGSRSPNAIQRIVERLSHVKHALRHSLQRSTPATQ